MLNEFEKMLKIVSNINNRATRIENTKSLIYIQFFPNSININLIIENKQEINISIKKIYGKISLEKRLLSNKLDVEPLKIEIKSELKSIIKIIDTIKDILTSPLRLSEMFDFGLFISFNIIFIRNYLQSRAIFYYYIL